MPEQTLIGSACSGAIKIVRFQKYWFMVRGYTIMASPISWAWAWPVDMAAIVRPKSMEAPGPWAVITRLVDTTGSSSSSL